MATDLLSGNVPSDWEFTTLGQACERGRGYIRTGPFGSQLHASDYASMGVPSIMPTNIGDNRVIEAGIMRITERDADRLAQHRVRPGDIIYSRRGDIEKRALIRPHEEGWLCGTGCLKVRLGNASVDPLFASYYLGHPDVRSWIARHAVGATMPNLNTAILSAVPFVVPPLSEQRAIACILGALDDKIELNRKMNETLEQMAQAIFKSWFIDFDGHTEFQDSPLGPIPKGWRAVTINDAAQRIAMGPFGSNIKTENFVTTGVPVIRGGNLKDGFRDSGFVFLTEAKANELARSQAVKGDLVLTHRGTLGQIGLIPDSSRFPRYIVSQSQMVLSPRRDVVSPLFLYHYFVTGDGMRQLLTCTSTTGVPAIGQPSSSLRKLELCVPPFPVMSRFTDCVGALHGRIWSSGTESETLAELRDTLLPKLISGEIRIKDAEKTVGEAT